MPHLRRRSIRTALLHVLGALFIAVGVPATPALAHGSGSPTPADGELLLGTPPEVLVELPGEGPVELELSRAQGEPIPFTGMVERSPGLIRAVPPVLEHGTYVLEWRSSDGSGWSTFNVGEPDAVIDSLSLPSRPLPLILLGVVLLGCAVLGGVRRQQSGANRRGVRTAAGALLAVAGGVALSPPTSLGGGAGLLLLSLGAVGGHLLLDTIGGSGRPGRGDTARAVLGGSVVAGIVAAALLRSIPVNPFSGASLLGYGAGLILLGVFTPMVVTSLVARYRGVESRGLFAPGAVILAVTVLAGAAAGVAVDARVGTLANETVPAATCLAGTNRLQIQRCLDASLVATVKTEGVTVALDELKRLLTVESRARYFCHEASHAVGRESLRLNGTLAEAFRDGYDVCDFGYYHGIVEGAAGGFDDATFLDAVPTLCEEFASAEELFYMQCNHGIGHAAARRTNNDMLRSLEFCDALELNANLTGERLRIAQNGCGTGVTMEWFATATADPNAAVTPRVSRPRDVCNAVPERWATECIEYVGNTLDASDPVNSLAELGAWCETTRYTEACYRGLARAAAGVGIPARDAIGVCGKAASTGARDECVTFYIAAVATTIDFSVDAVDRICRDLPEADRSGPRSLCERVREAVVEVLAAGDGKNAG